jgi:ABC-type cobalamin transport system ATPase subunit
MDELDTLLAYEQGELGTKETLELFSGLVQSGLAWRLQGAYGRTAQRLIVGGFLTTKGEITASGKDLYEAE